jgi:hypothetical protein
LAELDGTDRGNLQDWREDTGGQESDWRDGSGGLVLLGRGTWVAMRFWSGSRGLEEVHIVEFRRYVHDRIHLTVFGHRHQDHIGER